MIKKSFFILWYFFLFYGYISNSVYCQQLPSGYNVQGNQCSEVFIPDDWIEEPGCCLNDRYVPSLSDKKAGYALFKRHYLALAFPNISFENNEINKALKIFVSLGEYEPLVFCVKALEPLENIEVSIGDLVNEFGKIIKKENIDLRILKYFPLISKNKKKHFRYAPLILEKYKIISIDKWVTQEYWLTIYAPKNAAPGNYKAKITIKPANKEKKKLDIVVTVLPFHLKKPQRKYGIYYNLDKRWKGFYPENIEKHFIDIREHGLSTLTLYGIPQIKGKGENVELDFSVPGFTSPWPVKTFMEYYLNSGLKAPLIFIGLDYVLRIKIKSVFGYEMYSKEFDFVYKNFVKMLEGYRLSENWPEFIFSVSDEPANDPKKMQSTEYYLQLLKQILPGVKTYITLYGGWKGIDDGKALDQWLDLRCYDWLNKKLIQDTKKSNDQLWVYNGGSFGRNPAVDRFFYGFYAERVGADGITQWVYQWAGSLGTSYDQELKTGLQGWYYTYPSFDGPIPTIGWEGIREGIDDARYVRTLKSLISEARKVGTPFLMEKAEAAEEKISRILQNIDIDTQTEKRYLLTKSLAKNFLQLDLWRREIASEIIKLQLLLEGIK
ncbi:MAG: hypothetical protein DRP78_04410 [Candidatus Omnitrophota bacterium]|nr:MAG: hypothetical protein DRP78_04410 [Candidatus Omnitrophota bacterium]